MRPLGEPSPTPERFARELPALLDAIPADRRPTRLAVEPGRCLVARAGWLVARVLHVRERGGPQVVLDAGMTELIRPALYGARHPIRALADRRRDGGARRSRCPTRVDGPICESTDALGTHDLPPLRRGDLVAIADAGAYAASLGSTYNGRPRPPQVLARAPTATLTLGSAARATRARSDSAAASASAVAASWTCDERGSGTGFAGGPLLGRRRDGHAAVLARHPAARVPRRARRDPPGPDRRDPPRVPRRPARTSSRPRRSAPTASGWRRSGSADQAGRLDRRGAQIAREARDVAGRDVLVAGSIGPLGAPDPRAPPPRRGGDPGGVPRDRSTASSRAASTCSGSRRSRSVDHLLLAVEEATARRRPADRRAR